MMAWVSGNEINILLDQPITQEMLKGLNARTPPGSVSTSPTTNHHECGAL